MRQAPRTDRDRVERPALSGVGLVRVRSRQVPRAAAVHRVGRPEAAMPRARYVDRAIALGIAVEVAGARSVAHPPEARRRAQGVARAAHAVDG